MQRLSIRKLFALNYIAALRERRELRERLNTYRVAALSDNKQFKKSMENLSDG